MRIVVGTVLGLACALLVACGSGPAPSIQPGPQVQDVPGVASSDFEPLKTWCLAQGLRVFESTDGHGRKIDSVVNVMNLPPTHDYRCP